MKSPFDQDTIPVTPEIAEGARILWEERTGADRLRIRVRYNHFEVTLLRPDEDPDYSHVLYKDTDDLYSGRITEKIFPNGSLRISERNKILCMEAFAQNNPEQEVEFEMPLWCDAAKI